ncbi:MAG: RidA family protein [Bryobacteraceae bacterium]|nr:RidA family protein [Bryobacteraceae bacterium]
MEKRRNFLKSATKMSAGGAMATMAMAASTGGREKVAGGVRVGNLYFSSGLTGVRPEARKDPLAFGGDIKEQTDRILKMHKDNLEKLGSSLENVVKVTVFLADVKTEKNAMNEVYAKYFPKDPPSRSAFGVEFPDTATRVEIETVALIPG